MIALFSVEILLFSSYNKQVKREENKVIVHKSRQSQNNFGEKRIINGRI